MVPYHRPKSGHITCYLNPTYHVLLTERMRSFWFLRRGARLTMRDRNRRGERSAQYEHASSEDE